MGVGGFRGGAGSVFSCSCLFLLFAPARMVVLIKVALGVSPCEGLREGCFLWSHAAGQSSTVELSIVYILCNAGCILRVRI